MLECPPESRVHNQTLQRRENLYISEMERKIPTNRESLDYPVNSTCIVPLFVLE